MGGTKENTRIKKIRIKNLRTKNTEEYQKISSIKQQGDHPALGKSSGRWPGAYLEWEKSSAGKPGDRPEHNKSFGRQPRDCTKWRKNSGIWPRDRPEQSKSSDGQKLRGINLKPLGIRQSRGDETSESAAADIEPVVVDAVSDV